MFSAWAQDGLNEIGTKFTKGHTPEDNRPLPKCPSGESGQGGGESLKIGQKCQERRETDHENGHWSFEIDHLPLQLVVSYRDGRRGLCSSAPQSRVSHSNLLCCFSPHSHRTTLLWTLNKVTP